MSQEQQQQQNYLRGLKQFLRAGAKCPTRNVEKVVQHYYRYTVPLLGMIMFKDTRN